MKHNESRLQQECVKWFRYQYPNVIIFSIPNGGKRNIITAARMKAEGQLAGVADLFVMLPANGYHGLFIEMKYGNGKPTENQRYFKEKAEMNGYKYAICNTFQSFQQQITAYLQ